MRRTLTALACLTLIAASAPGCATRTQPRDSARVQAHDAGIHEAFQRALHASDPWERELWKAEYERRVRAYEQELDATGRENAARAEFLRQLAVAAEQAGLLYLQSRLAE